MRSLALMFALLLTTAWAAAQNTPDQSNSVQSSSNANQATAANAGNQTKIQGCLSGSNGSYTLTDRNGTSYQLTGDTSQLDQHVGHEVQLTGSQTSTSASATAPGSNPGTNPASSGQTGAAAQTSFSVSNIKHISKTCSNTGSAR
jgi:hypothetical protein